MGVVGLRTVDELNGTSCLSLEQLTANKQTLCISRSFEKTVQTRTELENVFITLQIVHLKNYKEAGWSQAPSPLLFRAILLEKITPTFK
jgi:hypothetical protein